jgi:predicted nucleotidyltransferase
VGVNIQKEVLRPIRDYLAQDPGVLLAYLFGSQAMEKSGPMSDYEFGLLVKSPSAEVRYHLGHKLAKILKTDRVDIVFLNQAPVELAYAIIAQGQLIYQRDLADRVETEAQIMSRYGDYLPVLRAQRHDILRGDQDETGIQRYRAAFRRTERTLAAIRATQEQKPE